MRNLFLMLAFMLVGTFAFANIPVNGDFPEYDSSLKIAKEDCACDGAFTSCSADGWCACSCGWFSCSCETHDSNTRIMEIGKNEVKDKFSEGVSMNEMQYKNTKLFAIVLKSMGENKLFNKMANMVQNLKDKNYAKFHSNKEILISRVKSLNKSKKDILNSFFATLNAEGRV